MAANVSNLGTWEAAILGYIQDTSLKKTNTGAGREVHWLKLGLFPAPT